MVTKSQKCDIMFKDRMEILYESSIVIYENVFIISLAVTIIDKGGRCVMKKLRDRILSIIAVTAVLAFSSCGSPHNAPAVTETSFEQTTAAATESTVYITESSSVPETIPVTESYAISETLSVTESIPESGSNNETGSEESETTESAEISEITEISEISETAGITSLVSETEEITETSFSSSESTEPETVEFIETTLPAAVTESGSADDGLFPFATDDGTTGEAVTQAPENAYTEVHRTAAKPSPSQIKEVSSPGKTVFGPDKAKFDYSNCSKGYVSVNYTGSTKLKMLLKKDGVQYDYDIPGGKGIQYFTLSMGSGKYVVEIYEMVSGGKYIKLFSDTFTTKIADTTNMYLFRNQYVNFNVSSKCVAKASEVCAGCTTNLQKISAVFKFVTDNIKYDKALAATVTSGYIPDPDSVLAKKKGICFDYASLTAAMLRSQGVPTRLVIGYASPNIYHAWNEVYTPEKGWIAAEIQLTGTGFRRIDTTFYASASNKKTFADYIAKSGNYSDVYIY